MRLENRCERMVARADPAAAEKRLHQRLLVARLEAVAFKGCSGTCLHACASPVLPVIWAASLVLHA